MKFISWVCGCGFDHWNVQQQEFGNFLFWEVVLVLVVVSAQLCIRVPEGCRRFTFMILIANILPRAHPFSQKSDLLPSSCSPGLTRPGLRTCLGRRCWVELGRGCVSVLEADLFGVWPDVLLQLCLGKCTWMVCCCHTSFNSVPSFY